MQQEGFTLVELMVVIVMSSVILLGALEFTTFQQYRSAELSRRIENQTNVMIALQQIGRDIFQAGFGAMDIPTASAGTPPEIMANDLALANLDGGLSGTQLFNKSVGGVWPTVAGSDELILAATSYGRAPVANRFAHVVSGSTQTSLVLADYGNDPFQPGDSIILFAPNRSAYPKFPLQQIYKIAGVATYPGNPNLYTVQLAIPLPSVPADGTIVFGVVPNPAREKLYKVQYAVIDGGNQPSGEPPRGELRRIRFLNGASSYAASTWEALPLLSNVLDFQVQFLVFPCNVGASAPVWMDSPDTTEFVVGGSAYPDDLSRIVHRRARILAVRVTLLVEAERKIRSGISNIHLAPNVTTLQVQNHTVVGLVPDKEYILREEIFDPINYRMRDGNWTVRDSASNLNAMNGSNCALVGGV